MAYIFILFNSILLNSHFHTQSKIFSSGCLVDGVIKVVRLVLVVGVQWGGEGGQRVRVVRMVGMVNWSW